MAITILRPNQEFTVKANVTRGDTQLVSWIIFSGHNSESMNILAFYPKNGVELHHNFPDEGKFRLAAYNKEIQTKEDFQGSAELKHVDVEIKYNRLDGSKLSPKNPGNFLAGDDFRKDFPAVFEAKFLINPPNQEEISRLQFILEDGSGNTLNEGSNVSNVFTFTPRNSNAKYTIKAIYTNESGEATQQTFSGTSKAISVRDITHGAEVVRPGEPMTFSVTKTQFGAISSNSDFPEQGNIKWNLDKILIGTGRSITISGNQLMQKRKYHIEAYATSAVGNTKGSNTDNTKNDWHFEVKENIVESIKSNGKAKLGKSVEFEIEKMTFPNYDAAKDGSLVWEITGSENKNVSSGTKLIHQFSIAGDYTIDCVMGGRKSRNPLKINVIQPKIISDTAKWIDNDNGASGNIIKEAGYGQEVCAYVKYVGLEKEEAVLEIYDDDSTGSNIVFSTTATLPDTPGVYWPFKLDDTVKQKIEEKGLTKPGELYFKIIPKDASLKVENGNQALGKSLNVQSEPKIINAYFCDANDTQKFTISPLSKALYFKVYAANMVDKKVEINFATESDAYWTWDEELLFHKWKDIQDKFKNEKIRDTKTATFNNKGEVLVPVDLSKLGTPKNYILLNAMIKVIEEKKEGEIQKEEQGFYMAHGNLVRLFPDATLPTISENNGAVKVGREQLNGGENGTCICKETNLIWGGHPNVTCEFRKKVIDISKRQNFDPNDLMAVMKVETSGTFSSSKIELKDTKEKRKDGTFKREYRGLTKDEIMKLDENFSGAVGLIQFTPTAISSLNEKYSLSLTKRKLALMPQLDQLDYVEKYIELWKKTKNITSKISLSDLYVLVFAPNYFGTPDNTTLYKEGSDYYNANASVDTDGKNGITKNEIAARAILAKSEGDAYKTSKFSCGNGNSSNNNIDSKEVVTFHIYFDGKIEKRIPKSIKEAYKQKYKYVFHDKEKKEHDICVVDWHTTSRKLPSRSKLYKKPTHSKILSDDNISEGQTRRRVMYENGDIAEYGSNNGDTFWRLYSATNEKIELIKMPDTVNYVKYSFSGTKRIYTGPNYFAGFIGALAITELSVTTTGSCFREGSCFPSQFHVNGESIDTIYFGKLETDQKFIDAMKSFHFGERKVGNDAYFTKLKNVSDGGDLHDSHLHCGEFDNSKIIEIKEK
ncbi:hypothetical protein [Chryseobacterium shigense]|uniref:Uncharacterized protein n=1 Tax=Chryseobacterium shigense TaxID=297244 RepID=A0A841N6T5_9FLAO|nr:hypothetical protein [Chryseobacterium shigense]MBB6369170.1 hypothetical protein [Chryseobacterium shigense]